MELKQKWFLCFIFISVIATNSNATSANINHSIDNGLRYLESVQLEYGEFPTIFTPNIEEPNRSLSASFDSNLFTTVMLADALHTIKNPRVERIQKKSVAFIQSQLINSDGLWSYMTTHNPKPFYPNTIDDVDDTAFASMVLQQNHVSFPDNHEKMNANKNADGVYYTFFLPPHTNSIDCGVNANVLSYMLDNDDKVCRYINEQVAQGNNCAVYYTLRDAYYLIARAYEMGATCLKPSSTHIINYVIAQFKNGNIDNSPFKTAIGLNTLLSFDYQGPEIQQAKEYLFKTQSVDNGSWPADDFWLWAGVDDNGNPVLLGRSSSSALTTAIALKALNKLNQ